MPVVTSSLSEDQQKDLLSLLGHVRLHLLYKASVHGFTALAFHSRCDWQGPTVIAAYNAAGFVFGAHTSQDYTQSGVEVCDEKAFLYSIQAGGNTPLRVAGIHTKCAFNDNNAGPDFGALVFLHENAAKIQSNPGGELHLSFEVYRVEGARRQQLMKSIISYKPEVKSVQQARVVLVGPVGAGKSTFFNSVNSMFRGNMTSQAIAGTAGKSVTTQFRAYNIKAGKGGGVVPLILCDTMGLEENAEVGLDIEDLIHILKGNVKDRYLLNPLTPIQGETPGFKKQATLNDVIHCVVYVVDTCKVSLLSQKMLDKFASIRKKTNHLGIPQILLMTKVDEACPLAAEDLQNVYRSVYLQRKARELSESFGIPLSCVLLVKSYSAELELDRDVDILLLTAVDQMLNYTDSFFENQVIEEDREAIDLYSSVPSQQSKTSRVN
uniref:Interferon induced protein 44c2 n=1 Tax=Cyclopterus lumpus TaxID=8103 RepID=A0A8C3A4V4_CYCLU